MQLRDREIENIEEIGQDPFGRVFKGLWNGRSVAVRCADAFDEAAIRRAPDLNRSIRSVRHGALPAYYGVGIENRSPFLVMDFIEGDDLDSLLNKSNTKISADPLWCTTQLSGALAEIHYAGMAHGCVTARNVLFADANVHLVDMTFLPPMAEAAPERYVTPWLPALPRDPADRMKRDLYALGVVLFELATGTRFPKAFRAADLAGTPLEPIVGIVSRLLDPDPDSGYENAREVSEDLAVAIGEAPAPLDRLSAVPASSSTDYGLLAALEERFVEIARPHVEAALQEAITDTVAAETLGEANAVLSSIVSRRGFTDEALKAEIDALAGRLAGDVGLEPGYIDWRARQVGGLLATHWIGLLRESVSETVTEAPLAELLFPWSSRYGSSSTDERQQAEFSELIEQLVIDRDAVNAIFETFRKEVERSPEGFPLPGGIALERRDGQLCAVRRGPRDLR